MEKGTAHYKLAVVKALIQMGKVLATKSAREGAAALGFDFDAVIGVVMANKRARLALFCEDTVLLLREATKGARLDLNLHPSP